MIPAANKLAGTLNPSRAWWVAGGRGYNLAQRERSLPERASGTRREGGGNLLQLRQDVLAVAGLLQVRDLSARSVQLDHGGRAKRCCTKA